MKKTNLIMIIQLFLFSNVSFSSTHHIPLTAEDQGVNIPVVGSSLFDKIFSQQKSDGSSYYEIPFPIGNLMNHIEGDEARLVHTMLPFSRSLQRPDNISYRPLLNPRLVFSVKSSSYSMERAKLFIGYVKKADQLEVISYNDEAGRYEYQLVKNYSKNPQIFYVNRGKCLSCHQGQAPIFSVPGWQDTNSGVMGNLIAAKLKLTGPNDQAKRKEVGKLLFGEMPSRDAVGNFDALVREANQIALDERIWAIGCGVSNSCRLGLLLGTLAPKSKIYRLHYENTKSTLRNSELSGQNLYSSMLSSTDIGVVQAVKDFGSTGKGTSYENIANNDLAISSIIGNIYKLKKGDNPATRRNRNFGDDQLVPKKLSGFTADDLQVLKNEVRNIENVLMSLFKKNHPLFSQTAINKPLVMYTILNEVNSPIADYYKGWVTRNTPTRILFKGKTIPVFSTKPLNVFARYCHQCHATGLKFPPQFLTGTEQEVETKIKGLKKKIHFKLKYHLMPPNKEERMKLNDSGDIAILLEYLNALKN